eukprot:scaffold2049_cov236-Chaetoceros_neogracile.AAC.4
MEPLGLKSQHRCSLESSQQVSDLSNGERKNKLTEERKLLLELSKHSSFRILLPQYWGIPFHVLDSQSKYYK